MKTLFCFFISFFAMGGASPAFAAREWVWNDLYEPSLEPLTTEKIWTLDPGELNPRYQNWVLNREVELLGLEAVPGAQGKFKIQIQGVGILSRSYIRDESSFYQPMSRFPCTSQSPNVEEQFLKGNAVFSTPEGVRKAADLSAKLWSELARKARPRLRQVFDQIESERSEEALTLGRRAFQLWLAELELAWRKSAPALARKQEWAFYSQQAHEQNLCRGGKKHTLLPIASPLRPEVIAPPVSPSPAALLPLARAPARLWNGLYSVRLTVRIGTLALNGQFLINSASAQSSWSPYWLEKQGIDPAWVSLPSSWRKMTLLQKTAPNSIAHLASTDQVELSGQDLPLREFLIQEPPLFGSPESSHSCCDGMLGHDFLRLFVVELRPGPPVEVILWPRYAYQVDETKTAIIPILSQSTGELLSSCKISKNSSSAAPQWVQWKSIQPQELMLSSRSSFSPPLQMSCGPVDVASRLAPTFSVKNPPSSSRAQVGMALLGRGNWIIDLGHGWIGLNRIGLSRSTFRNRTGVDLRYQLEDQERVLRVKSISGDTPLSRALQKLGIRSGMKILRIKDQSVEDFSQWQLEQLLDDLSNQDFSLSWMGKALKGRGGTASQQSATIQLQKP